MNGILYTHLKNQHRIIEGGKMNPCNLTFSVTAIANAIAKNLSVEEIKLLASLFSQLGYTLETIASQRELCDSRHNNLNE